MPTTLIEVNGVVKVPHESGDCNRRRNGGADCHPEGFAIGEAVIGTMLDTENSHRHDVDNICKKSINVTNDDEARHTMNDQKY